MLDYKAIGARVKKARQIEGITQAELAELTDMSNTYISRIETGAKKASLESLAKMSCILHIPIDVLVFGSDAHINQIK